MCSSYRLLTGISRSVATICVQAIAHDIIGQFQPHPLGVCHVAAELDVAVGTCPTVGVPLIVIHAITECLCKLSAFQEPNNNTCCAEVI